MDDDRVRLWVGAEDGIMRLSLLLSLLWAFLQEMHVGNLRSMFAKRKATQLEEVLSSPEDEGALLCREDVEPAKLFQAGATPKLPPAVLSKQEQKFFNRCQELLQKTEGLDLTQHHAKLLQLKSYYEEIQRRGHVVPVPGSNAQVKARLSEATVAIVRATSLSAAPASAEVDGAA